MPGRSKPSVLILRPQPQGLQLQSLLQDHDWGVIYFPTLEIVPVSNLDTTHLQKEYEEGVSAVVFTSYHAVVHFAKFFLELWRSTQTKPHLFAIGQATAEALEQTGLAGAHFPQASQSSETLTELIHNQLGDLDQRKVWIVTGIGGRMVLPDELRYLRALPSIIACYQRVCPQQAITVEQYQQWQDQNWQYIVATSQEILVNLLKLLPQTAFPDIFAKKLVVFSDRIRVHAVELGFKAIRVSQTASDASILAELETWRKEK